MNLRNRSLLISVLVLTAGCASFATLKRVALNGNAAPISNSSVTVSRGGSTVDAESDLALEAGDRITTSSSYGAVIDFSGGASLVLRPNSSVSLNPDAPGLEGGEVLFRPGGGVSRLTAGAMTITASGAVAVRSGGAGADVIAIGGSATVTPSGGAGQQVPVRSQLSGGSVQKLSRERLNEAIAWANGIDVPQRRLIPDVSGMAAEAASGIAKRAYVSATLRPVPAPPDQRDMVQAQSPGPGATASSLQIDVGAESVTVADVVNRPLAEAEQWLRDGRLQLGPIQKRLSVNRDTPVVVGQSPPAGQLALKDAKVSLTVEYPGAIVPGFDGMTRDEAILALERAHLRCGATQERYSSSVMFNCVCSCEPKAGTLVERGTEVRLVVSRGALSAPEVRQPVAVQMAQVTCRWEPVPDATDYQIKIQHPSGGTVYDKTFPTSQRSCDLEPTWQAGWSSSPYTWQVRGKADGEWGDWSPPQSFTYQPPDVSLPQLANMKYEDATKRLKHIQCLQQQEWSTKPPGQVIRTEPDAGTTLPPGSTVTFYVSKGRNPAEVAAEKAAAEKKAADAAVAARLQRLASNNRPPMPTVASLPKRSHPPYPRAGLKTGGQGEQMPVLQWCGVTYWAYSLDNNSTVFAITAYDGDGNVLKTWDKVGARYLERISIDDRSRTVSFWGQANQKVTMPIRELGVHPGQADLQGTWRDSEGNDFWIIQRPDRIELNMGSEAGKRRWTHGGAVIKNGELHITFMRGRDRVGDTVRAQIEGHGERIRISSQQVWTRR